MACDPNTLLEQAKCLSCIPQGMMEAVQVSLLCQIAESGGGSQFVLKAGDTMTGPLIVAGTTFPITLDPDNTLGGLGNFSVGIFGTSFLSFSDGDLIIGTTAIKTIIKSNGNLGFFGTAAQAQQVSGANLTNNVTVGGVNDTISDFTSLTVYATDAAAIRNDIYQLARKLKQINDGLRVYGLFT